MKLRKILAVLAACAMFAGFATITASADLAFSNGGWVVNDLSDAQAFFGIRMDGYEPDNPNAVLESQLAPGTSLSQIAGIRVNLPGVEGDGSYAIIGQSASLNWWSQEEYYPDEGETITRPITFTDDDGWIKILVTAWGNDVVVTGPVQVNIVDAAGNVIPVYALGAAPSAAEEAPAAVADEAPAPAPATGGEPPKAGVAGVATVAGVALVAAAGIVVASKKRK